MPLYFWESFWWSFGGLVVIELVVFWIIWYRPS